jgi:hypothetical protein
MKSAQGDKKQGSDGRTELSIRNCLSFWFHFLWTTANEVADRISSTHQSICCFHRNVQMINSLQGIDMHRSDGVNEAKFMCKIDVTFPRNPIISSGALKNSEIRRYVSASRLAHEIDQDMWLNCLFSGFRNSVSARE